MFDDINCPFSEPCQRATCRYFAMEQERLKTQKILFNNEYKRGFRDGLEVVKERFIYCQPETIKIGSLEYDKREVEERLKDIKPIK